MSAINDAYNLLASKFPKRYNVRNTRFLSGLLKALAEGDGYISTQVEATRDNLIAVTASGRFLDRAASLYGIVRGQGTGILDPDFQKLIPVMGLSPKQISHILLKIIDSFYGPFASHANLTALNSEPYALKNGSRLLVRIDDRTTEIIFASEDALDITQATADEVAIAISQRTKGKLIGSVLTDARTGNKFVNIRSATIGSQGFVQVLGGDAQIPLHFPTVRALNGTLATWSVSRYLGTDEMLYMVTSGAPPNLTTALIQRKDLVTIRSDSGFASTNVGTFQVSAIGSNFFRVINPNGTTQSNVTNQHIDDFLFFNPTLANVLTSARPAAIVETSPRQLTIILPVTSPIVKRTILGGQHFHQGVSEITSATSNSVTLGSSMGFFPNGAFTPVISRKISRGVVSTIGASTVTLLNGQNWPTFGSFWAANTRTFYYYTGKTGNQLTGVTPTPPSDLTGGNVVYVERYSYTTVTGNTLNNVYPDPSDLEDQLVWCCGAETGTNFPGSFIYDPQTPFTVAADFTTIQEEIRQGSVKTLLQVADVDSFPDTGSIVLEFGTGAQEGPIRYLTKVGDNALILDPGHIFERDHLKGVGLRLVRSLGPYTPRNSGIDLGVFTTSTSPARDLLATYLRLIAASGVNLRFEIRIPEQKWDVLPNLYTTDPIDTEIITNL